MIHSRSWNCVIYNHKRHRLYRRCALRMRRRKIFQVLAAVIFISLGTTWVEWHGESIFGIHRIHRLLNRFETEKNTSKLTTLSYIHRFGHSDTSEYLSLDDLKSIIVDNEESCKHMRILVYDCSKSLCGGWGDRQKGIVSGFLLALLTNRYFAVNIDKPCDVEKFLEPAMYNWKLCKPYIDASRQPNETLLLNGGFRNAIPQMDFEREWNKRVVVLHFNSYVIDQIRHHKYARQRIRWMFDRTNPEIIRMILQALFTPGRRLMDELNDFVNSKTKDGQQLICSHIRIGRNPSIPNDSNLPTKMYANVSTIFSFLDEYNDVSKYVIYIATDSDHVREVAAEKFSNFANLNRKIVHVDRFSSKDNKTEVCDGFNTVLFEQYILTVCDFLIITRSNFGAIAAYLRGQSEHLYLHHTNRNEVIGTNLTNIQSVYGFV